MSGYSEEDLLINTELTREGDRKCKSVTAILLVLMIGIIVSVTMTSMICSSLGYDKFCSCEIYSHKSDDIYDCYLDSHYNNSIMKCLIDTGYFMCTIHSDICPIFNNEFDLIASSDGWSNCTYIESRTQRHHISVCNELAHGHERCYEKNKTCCWISY